MRPGKRARSQYGKRKAYGHSYGRSGSKYRATKNVYYKPSKKRWQWGYK